MAAVGVALAVRVVLVDDDLLAGTEQPARRPASSGRGSAPPPCRRTTSSSASTHSGRGVLRVRVVDVVARAVGEHGVDEVGLDLGGLGAVAAEAAGVRARGLVLEVPADLAGARRRR